MRELPEESVIVMDKVAFHQKRPLFVLAEKYGHRLVFFAALYIQDQSH